MSRVDKMVYDNTGYLESETCAPKPRESPQTEIRKRKMRMACGDTEQLEWYVRDSEKWSP